MDKTKFWVDLKSGSFAALIQESAPSQSVGSSREVFNIMKPIFSQEPDVEKMWGIFTDRKNNILSIDLLASGSISSSNVYPREIVKKALSRQACGLILVHNHPSGDPDPSPEDRALTKQILIPMTCVGVDVLDHIIIGNSVFFSFADEGILTHLKARVKELLAA